MAVPGGPTSREVRRPDQTTIRYTASGPDGGPTVVFIHGWGLARGDFDAVTEYLPENYRALAIDLAEHGDSRSLRGAWTVEEFARDVKAVLEAESVSATVVAGHSLGGAVAVEVGRLLPHAITHIIALDALHYLSMYPAQTDEHVEAIMRTLRDEFAAGVRGFVESGLLPGTDRASQGSISRRWCRCASLRFALSRGPRAVGHGRLPTRDEAADHRLCSTRPHRARSD